MNTLTLEAPEQETTEMVQRCMDKAYDLAIDHTIETVQTFLLDLPGLSEPLINKLKALKK